MDNAINVIIENGIYTTSELAPMLRMKKETLDTKCSTGEIKAKKPRKDVDNNWS